MGARAGPDVLERVRKNKVSSKISGIRAKILNRELKTLNRIFKHPLVTSSVLASS